ncbi:hypothetical protein K6119_02555 [Paracrocinitomix mangrovi]|uniref:hypothetical protein n=1 Tax=Paracrocinitomix mangrovi TaxID=2862509 RepID=UPI001C8DB5C1|nr:hypothetical protein [Paracrocinitomix mangrovi]UKN02400.1 hypothetical protein K6119_02555 [Paracrocinitomix mangrovi]
MKSVITISLLFILGLFLSSAYDHNDLGSVDKSPKYERSEINSANDHIILQNLKKQSKEVSDSPIKEKRKKPRPRLVGFFLIVIAVPIVWFGLFLTFSGSAGLVILGIIVFALALFLFVQGFRFIFIKGKGAPDSDKNKNKYPNSGKAWLAILGFAILLTGIILLSTGVFSIIANLLIIIVGFVLGFGALVSLLQNRQDK